MKYVPRRTNYYLDVFEDGEKGIQCVRENGAKFETVTKRWFIPSPDNFENYNQNSADRDTVACKEGEVYDSFLSIYQIAQALNRPVTEICPSLIMMDDIQLQNWLDLMPGQQESLTAKRDEIRSRLEQERSAYDLEGVEITEEDIDRAITLQNDGNPDTVVSDVVLQAIRKCLDEGLEEIGREN